MARSRLVLFTFIAALSALVPSLAAGVAAAEKNGAVSAGAARPAPAGVPSTRVVVDPLLRSQLERRPS
jgi:hypothetical protein